MGIFGGLGGAFLFEELRRGAIGTMTGFAYPEVLVSVYNYIVKNDIERARNIFYSWLPLIRYENSAGIGLSIRKELMKRRGFIKSADVRSPTTPIDTRTEEELNDLLIALDTHIKDI